MVYGCFSCVKPLLRLTHTKVSVSFSLKKLFVGFKNNLDTRYVGLAGIGIDNLG